MLAVYTLSGHNHVSNGYENEDCERCGSQEQEEVELPDIPLTDRNGSLAAFVEVVLTGKESETFGHNNLPTLALTFAAIEFACTGEPVYLS